MNWETLRSLFGKLKNTKVTANSVNINIWSLSHRFCHKKRNTVLESIHLKSREIDPRIEMRSKTRIENNLF